jgi:hypothetical protein
MVQKLIFISFMYLKKFGRLEKIMVVKTLISHVHISLKVIRVYINNYNYIKKADLHIYHKQSTHLVLAMKLHKLYNIKY